jgi:hypothetical protein
MGVRLRYKLYIYVYICVSARTLMHELMGTVLGWLKGLSRMIVPPKGTGCAAIDHE